MTDFFTAGQLCRWLADLPEDALVFLWDRPLVRMDVAYPTRIAQPGEHDNPAMHPRRVHDRHQRVRVILSGPTAEPPEGQGWWRAG